MLIELKKGDILNLEGKILIYVETLHKGRKSLPGFKAVYVSEGVKEQEEFFNGYHQKVKRRFKTKRDSDFGKRVSDQIEYENYDKTINAQILITRLLKEEDIPTISGDVAYAGIYERGLILPVLSRLGMSYIARYSSQIKAKYAKFTVEEDEFEGQKVHIALPGLATKLSYAMEKGAGKDQVINIVNQFGRLCEGKKSLKKEIDELVELITKGNFLNNHLTYLTEATYLTKPAR